MVSMAIIPQDVITTHILCHLPSKSVGRFRCVSKEWLSVLTDPQFIQTHQKTLNTNRVFFKCEDGSLDSAPYDNHELVSTQTKKHDFGCYRIDSIDGSVNGLVLASTYGSNRYKDRRTLVILNLTTKDYVELQRPVLIHDQSSYMNGFGYDSVSDDYKVFIISSWLDVRVYSLRTNTWKQASDPPYKYRVFRGSGVFVNGFLHWIFERDSKPVIVAFSLADEKLSELPPPKLDPYTELVAVGEKLVMVNRHHGYMWLMKEYGVHKSWTKIGLHGFYKIPRVFFYDNGKLVFINMCQLNKYDIEKQTFSRSVDISYMKIGGDVIGSYAESLISPRFNISE